MNTKYDQGHSAVDRENELQRRIEEFQHQQSSWEVRRNAEQESLEQTAKQLSDAWLALEDEQRSLLGANAVSVLVSPKVATQQVQAVELTVGPIVEPIATAVETTPQPTPISNVNTRVAIPRDIMPRDIAVRQFEKLRNEIQSTRR